MGCGNMIISAGDHATRDRPWEERPLRLCPFFTFLTWLGPALSECEVSLNFGKLNESRLSLRDQSRHLEIRLHCIEATTQCKIYTEYVSNLAHLAPANKALLQITRASFFDPHGGVDAVIHPRRYCGRQLS